MTHSEPAPAIVLADGAFATSNAKTAHGLVRGTSRFRVLSVVDPLEAGRDAGIVLEGRPRGIPIHRSVRDALAAAPVAPAWAIVGVATAGGRIPESLKGSLREAVEAGLSVVNGLHQGLDEDAELAELARRRGVRLVDIRRPKPRAELHFWSGAIREVEAPRVAVLGTDCALGKRTTTRFLLEALRDAGLPAEMIYTGQTGWLQGADYGCLLDCLPNDFVSGELEHAVVSCWRERRPRLMLIEGQSALRNPSGPCGAELLLSAGAKGVILQHAPGRRHYEGSDVPIADIAEEIELIRLYGSRVLAVTLNHEGLDPAALARVREELESRLGLPVVRPLEEGVERLVPVLTRFAETSHAPEKH